MSQFIDSKNIPSFDWFQKMKYNDGNQWRNLRLDYLKPSRLKDNPSLALPNQDHIVIPDEKFIKHLFNPENKTDWDKEQLISKEFGIDINNYD